MATQQVVTPFSTKNTKSSKYLNILELSDIHLIHPRTPTRHIIENLRREIPDTAETGEYDMIIIAGDLWDRLTNLSNPDLIEVNIWTVELLKMCKRRDIVLRILEGTPGHDWEQCRMIPFLNEHANIGADLKYVTTLSIEYLERFGIHLLYVPDEWRPDTDDIWAEVVELLREKQIEKVDFTVLHGAFNYQLPGHLTTVPVHIPERYLEITQYAVFGGHVHKHSVYDRILVAGSFDRLTHGEEEPKGHLRVKVFPKGDLECQFVENKNAFIYKTVDCTGLDVDTALEFIGSEIQSLPAGSHVRIRGNKTDDIMVSMDVLRKEFPVFEFTTKANTDREQLSQKTLETFQPTHQAVSITKSNISELLLGQLKGMAYDATLLGRAEEILNEHI